MDLVDLFGFAGWAAALPQVVPAGAQQVNPASAPAAPVALAPLNPPAPVAIPVGGAAPVAVGVGVLPAGPQVQLQAPVGLAPVAALPAPAVNVVDDNPALLQPRVEQPSGSFRLDAVVSAIHPSPAATQLDASELATGGFPAFAAMANGASRGSAVVDAPFRVIVPSPTLSIAAKEDEGVVAQRVLN